MREIKTEHLDPKVFAIYPAELDDPVELVVASAIIHKQDGIFILIRFDLPEVEVFALRVVEKLQLLRSFRLVVELQDEKHLVEVEIRDRVVLVQVELELHVVSDVIR